MYRLPKLPLAAIALLVAGLLLLPVSPRAAEVYWFSDITHALAAQKQAERPILIYFRLAQAKPCQEFEQQSLTNPIITPLLAEKFVCMYVNADQNRALANRFGVFQVPTVVMLDLEGSEFMRLVTSYPPDRLLPVLQGVEDQMAESARRVDPSEVHNQRAAQAIFHEPFDSLYGWGNDGSAEGCHVNLSLVRGIQGNAFKVDYIIRPEGWSYVQFNRMLTPQERFRLPREYTVIFQFAGAGGNNKVDFKFVDGAGTNYGAFIEIPTDFKGRQYVLESDEIGYLWGGTGGPLGEVMNIQVAVTPNQEYWDEHGPQPTGAVYLDELIILPGIGWNIPSDRPKKE